MPNPYNSRRQQILAARDAEVRRVAAEPGRTTAEVARMFDLTAERVRQILRKTPSIT
jgi:DNA-directed RNA polymerase sigma subunit (sigma70/sigma32)